MAKIKDIFAGKPDAKDEIEIDGIDAFLENYVIPENFNLESIINGSGSFITGYKGTGKTAVLFYIDNEAKAKDNATLSSFIFFKGDYSDAMKQEMVQLAKRLTSTITIGNDVVLEGTDFEYIWRWLLYSRIIKDNEEYNQGIFINNDKWELFEKKIKQIECGKKRHLFIPPKLSFSMPINDITTMTAVTPTMELDFQDSKVEETIPYKNFTKIIDEADDLFCQLTRTDIPYFIFIDELEAYFGDDGIFKRDLRLIRDLIFTAKKLNVVFSRNKSVKTKIVCSIRSEIVNAINRFIVTKELNKVISGFEVPLIWDYTTTASYNHPIIKILINRIVYGEKKTGDYLSEQELIKKWFPEKLYGKEAATYILDNSWCKPRDIVRLISSAQNCLATSNDSFSQKTIDMCKKRYSLDSLTELKEELRALYSPNDVNAIITCLSGFMRVFSIEQLKERIRLLYSDSVLNYRLNDVLSDLYRIGIIGNHIPETYSYRWQHKSDDGIIIDNTWSIIIHPALLSALSVNSKQDSAIKHLATLQKGTTVKVTVQRIKDHYAIGWFVFNGNKYKAYISSLSFATSSDKPISTLVHLGEEFDAELQFYDRKYNNWKIKTK